MPTAVQVLGFVVAAVPVLLFVRWGILNVLKGKISEAKRGRSQPWKKDGDPALASDADPMLTSLDKIKWGLMSYFGRLVTPKLYPPPNLNFYDVGKYPGVKGMVALTIDDCFCRQGEKHSLMAPLRRLLAKEQHKATFFLTLQYSEGAWREKEIAEFVAEDHELANHCLEDREYDQDTEESFAHDLDLTDKFIRKMTHTNTQCKWFRAPSGNISNAMLAVLRKKKMVNVMLDSYANDPHIPDENFIATTMCHRVTHGSIMIIHMPERGFREWDFRAIELILEKLNRRGLRSVTLSQLEAAAMKKQA